MFKKIAKVALLGSFLGSIVFFAPLVSANVLSFLFSSKNVTSSATSAPAPASAKATTPVQTAKSASVPKPAATTPASVPAAVGIQTNTVGEANSSAGIFAASNSNSPFDINAEALKLSTEAQNLDPKVIKLGLEAYYKAHNEGLDKQQILTIVNYDQPSTNPRLYVFDLKSNNLLFKELVAHGKNSGGNVPTSFSNSPSSLKSSLGVFLTENTYIGHHGYSLKLAGLEKGFNDMAAAREIVVHAANYVSGAFAQAHGRLGKSWGCFAVNPSIASSLISTIKDGTLIFAYYPDQNYLSRSRFLT